MGPFAGVVTSAAAQSRRHLAVAAWRISRGFGVRRTRKRGCAPTMQSYLTCVTDAARLHQSRRLRHTGGKTGNP